MAFVDEAKILVKAGSGGKPCRSFYRDKYSRYPTPDGGDGGRGADIVFLADPNIHTLLDFKFRQHFSGEKGGNGSSNNKKGKDQEACIIKVPVGTIIKDLDADCLLRDLNRPFEKVLAAKGGKGGQGNSHKKEVIDPQPGEEKQLLLELKLIADCGIIGFPNVGKSTLLSAISSAKSKIAGYPFTTKEPVLGVVEDKGCSFTVADLPGLIEGAHEGRGLGVRFLKHAERNRILIHLLDMSGQEGRDPLEDYNKLNSELKFYSPQLSLKLQVIVANKMDLPQSAANLKKFKERVKKTIYPISAKDKAGLKVLINALRRKICKENSPEKSKE